MTEVEPVLDFASSGRSGRRNALPDILGSPAGVSPCDLPLKLAELSLTDGPGGPQSPSSQDVPSSADARELMTPHPSTHSENTHTVQSPVSHLIWTHMC
ncbi:cAMP-dependent protein kinase inhibitor beta-like [Triplophysa dalaica]|uniref:cAMP-dependent protein kinase inhibitor beta-like n=1 Tax=Triplophysa dalaica TaxID=1582913 RepID=UPI0024DF4291|nr:cAMP-dependent protein kinase inhibitor beta-like [Triplophysa dalaica]XP_056597897.1 cAMP-dependent protein kinase inhibitor beta-like [Triplophysa dalaica]